MTFTIIGFAFCCGAIWALYDRIIDAEKRIARLEKTASDLQKRISEIDSDYYAAVKAINNNFEQLSVALYKHEQAHIALQPKSVVAKNATVAKAKGRGRGKA